MLISFLLVVTAAFPARIWTAPALCCTTSSPIGKSSASAWPNLLRRDEGRVLWGFGARIARRARHSRGQHPYQPCKAACAFERALDLMRQTDYPGEGQG